MKWYFNIEILFSEHESTEYLWKKKHTQFCGTLIFTQHFKNIFLKKHNYCLNNMLEGKY